MASKSKTAAPFEDVLFTREGPIGILRLNRPKKLNALTLSMHDAISEGLRTFRRDGKLRVLVMTGTGRAFCAGDDMGESDPRTGVVPPEAETELAWHNLVREMRSTPKPVMLAVSSAWLKLIATNEIAPRLYTSSGCVASSAFTSDGRSARSPGTGSTYGNSSRMSVNFGLFWPLTMPNTSYPFPWRNSARC